MGGCQGPVGVVPEMLPTHTHTWLWALALLALFSLSFLSSSSSIFRSFHVPVPAALSFWFAAAPGAFWLAVHLRGLAVHLPGSRPKVGGRVKLAVRAWGLVIFELTQRWPSAPVGLLVQLACVCADSFCQPVLLNPRLFHGLACRVSVPAVQ